nr:hypothetical protein CFP56_62590 [Quercus suber]
MEVKGFDDERTKPPSVKAPEPDRGMPSWSLVEGKTDRSQTVIQAAEAVIGLEDGQIVTATNSKDTMFVGIEKAAYPTPVLVDSIEGLDNAINEEHHTSDRMGEGKDIREAPYEEIRKEEALMSGKDGMSINKGSEFYGDMEGEFVMGWADPNAKDKEEIAWKLGTHLNLVMWV